MVKKLTKYTYLEPLLNSRESLSLSEISKRLNQPHTSTRIYLAYFEKKGIIKKSVKGKMTFFSFNFENPFLFHYISLIEREKFLNKISEDLVLKETAGFLIDNFPNNASLIFGSSVENSKKANDIDIVVVGKIGTSFKKLENKINKKIHCIKVDSLSEIKNSLKKEIFNQHLIVNNYEKFLRWFH